MDIKLEIQKMAKEIGISKIGFTTADDFAYLEKSLRLGVEEGRTTGFEHKNIEDRLIYYFKIESNRFNSSKICIDSVSNLARILSLPRPSVSRSLSKMEKKNKSAY